MPEYVLVDDKYLSEKIQDIKDSYGKHYVSIRAFQGSHQQYVTVVPVENCKSLDPLEAFAILAKYQESNHEHTTGATDPMVGVK